MGRLADQNFNEALTKVVVEHLSKLGLGTEQASVVLRDQTNTVERILVATESHLVDIRIEYPDGGAALRFQPHRWETVRGGVSAVVEVDQWSKVHLSAEVYLPTIDLKISRERLGEAFDDFAKSVERRPISS